MWDVIRHPEAFENPFRSQVQLGNEEEKIALIPTFSRREKEPHVGHLGRIKELVTFYPMDTG